MACQLVIMAVGGQPTEPFSSPALRVSKVEHECKIRSASFRRAQPFLKESAKGIRPIQGEQVLKIQLARPAQPSFYLDNHDEPSPRCIFFGHEADA